VGRKRPQRDDAAQGVALLEGHGLAHQVQIHLVQLLNGIARKVGVAAVEDVKDGVLLKLLKLAGGLVPGQDLAPNFGVAS